MQGSGSVGHHALAFPSSPCLAFLSAKHFLLWQGCHGNGHAHTGMYWAMLLLFLQQLSKNDCPCLEWHECTPSARCRLWTHIVQIVISCYCVSGLLPHSWTLKSSQLCSLQALSTQGPQSTSELGDYRWAAAVTVPISQWLFSFVIYLKETTCDAPAIATFADTSSALNIEYWFPAKNKMIYGAWPCLNCSSVLMSAQDEYVFFLVHWRSSKCLSVSE